MDKIADLRTFRSGNRRAPHKPLLLLFALGQLQRGNRDLSFTDVKRALNPLLQAYAPPVKSRHQPELPYWHLSSDGLWAVDGADQMERQASGFPTMAAIRNSHGRLDDEFVLKVQSDSKLFESVVAKLLEEHFAPSSHGDILAAVGLDPLSPEATTNTSEKVERRRRDSRFRQSILRAYEHRCAFSGFRTALGGTFLGCEAAHVRWHAYDGPDDVSNGIALEPTIHRLFDVGAWSLTDDRRIIVSTQFTGSDEAISRIRGRHGHPLQTPLPGEPKVNVDFIRWHREPDLGGVFREPGLPL